MVDPECITAMDEPSMDEAYRQGYWAYGFGFEKHRNPYRADTEPSSDYWRIGWLEAQENDQG